MSIKRQAYTLTLLPPPPVPGERVFVGDGSGASATQYFVVPDNCYAISAVVVSTTNPPSPDYETRILRGATVLLGTDQAIGGAIGGGNGGATGPNGGFGSGGGGGAGGYTGNGGNGGNGNVGGSSGAPGNGGGGGGGGVGSVLQRGGGVGLLGIGANGVGGGYNTPGGHGSYNGSGVLAGAATGNGRGGNLRWRNDIPVTPGETLTVTLISTAPNGNGQNNAARIMWGNDGRSYPSNAGDSVPSGQWVEALRNTSWTVPDGVTSICACAQQQRGSSAAVTLVVAGTTVLRAQNGARIGDGGGDGGAGAEGGGGGGGYTGNGGNGGSSTSNGDGTSQQGDGSNGAGGAAAGGASGYVYRQSGPVWGGSDPYVTVPADSGGGVGISGAGASGTGSSTNGSPDPINGYMGGGDPGQAGGALSYKNSIAVTPGQVITVNAAGGRIRIIWGPARSYPSAAGNV